MSLRFRFPIWLWAVLAASTAASLWVAAERYRGETANRAVHLLIDMPDVRLLAGATGQTVPEVLDRLKASGATAVAVAEETLTNWFRRAGSSFGRANLCGTSLPTRPSSRALGPSHPSGLLLRWSRWQRSLS